MASLSLTFPRLRGGEQVFLPLPMGSSKVHVKDCAAQSALEIKLIICEPSPHARPPDKSFHHKYVALVSCIPCLSSRELFQCAHSLVAHFTALSFNRSFNQLLPEHLSCYEPRTQHQNQRKRSSFCSPRGQPSVRGGGVARRGAVTILCCKC